MAAMPEVIDICDPKLMERQHLMANCGMSARMIYAMMSVSDDMLLAGIKQGREIVATATGDKADLAQKRLRAAEIEAGLRGIKF